MKITSDEAKEIIGCFFHMVDGIYGSSYHDIGGGDGIEQTVAGKIKNIMENKSDDFFKQVGHNFKSIEIIDNFSLSEDDIKFGKRN